MYPIVFIYYNTGFQFLTAIIEHVIYLLICVTTHSGVTDTCIVDRGKNIVSASRDGTVKLWSCAKQVCLHTFDELEAQIVNCCEVNDINNTIELGSTNQPSRESRKCAKIIVILSYMQFYQNLQDLFNIGEYHNFSILSHGFRKIFQFT